MPTSHDPEDDTEPTTEVLTLIEKWEAGEMDDDEFERSLPVTRRGHGW